jgi:hypothetical protein
LASFIKFFGASFLSRTSVLVAEKARGQLTLEPGWMMQLPQVFLALLCLALGLFPWLGFDFIKIALDASKQGLGAMLASASPVHTGVWAGLSGLEGQAIYAPALLGLILAATWGLVMIIAHAGGALRRADAPWLCGYVRETESTRFSAHHFYGEFKKLFLWLGGHDRTGDPARLLKQPKP